MPLPDKVASSQDLVKLIRKIPPDILKEECIALAKERLVKHDNTLNKITGNAADRLIEGMEEKTNGS